MYILPLSGIIISKLKRLSLYVGSRIGNQVGTIDIMDRKIAGDHS